MEVLMALGAVIVLAALAPWLHRWIGASLAWLAALLAVMIVGLLAARSGAAEHGQTIFRAVWLGSLDMSFSLYVDGLGCLLGLLVAGIGAVIFAYSARYMQGHRAGGVFYASMLIFMAGMLGVVLAGNLLTLYVFWELTTISSFLLNISSRLRGKLPWRLCGRRAPRCWPVRC